MQDGLLPEMRSKKHYGVLEMLQGVQPLIIKCKKKCLSNQVTLRLSLHPLYK